MSSGKRRYEEKGSKEAGWGVLCLHFSMLLAVKAPFQHSPDREEQAEAHGCCGKEVQIGRNGQCKDPEGGVWLER